MARTLWLDSSQRLFTWDQTRLPFESVELELACEQDCADAIVTMQVRGAPLIGAVAAYGLAFALRVNPGDQALQAAFDRLLSTRPTAVNLRWALERVRHLVLLLSPAQRAEAAWAEACAICDEDVACNAAIGRHAAALLTRLARPDRPLQILTHCNAGRIATVEHGTALSPIYALHEAGIAVHVWVDETRPRNQGASLTAWELRERGVPHTVVVDNAGGLLMRQRQVDAVIVGCDRVAANGDVANKIGTYLKALAAQDNAVPFYVACPLSTIDPHCAHGDLIEIEQRSAREVTHLTGRDDEGRLRSVQITPDGSPAANPAFDVTPARLVTALVTELGVIAARTEAIAELLSGGGA
jgi:methylthioribose-1-phosphate isomerase